MGKSERRTPYGIHLSQMCDHHSSRKWGKRFEPVLVCGEGSRSPAGEALLLIARAELYRGDYRLADRFVSELTSVTPEAVQRVARRYMKGIRFAYVGDPSRLQRSLITRF